MGALRSGRLCVKSGVSLFVIEVGASERVPGTRAPGGRPRSKAFVEFFSSLQRTFSCSAFLLCFAVIFNSFPLFFFFY